MGKFTLYKHITLEKFGEDWKDAYIKFKGLDYKDFKTKLAKLASIDTENKEEVVDNMGDVIDLLTEKFVEGKAPVDGTLTDIKASELNELPLEVINYLMGFLFGGTEAST